MYYEIMIFIIIFGVGIISGKLLIPFLRKLKFALTMNVMEKF